jgi:uncharacterized membrane protein YtjA (UPF0391 family)
MFMLRATISLFFIACVVALIAAIFGFGGFAAGSAALAKTLFYVAISVAIIAMIGTLLFGRRQDV